VAQNTHASAAFRATLQLFDVGVNLMRQNLRRRGGMRVPPAQVLAHQIDADIEELQRRQKSRTCVVVLRHVTTLRVRRCFSNTGASA